MFIGYSLDKSGKQASYHPVSRQSCDIGSSTKASSIFRPNAGFVYQLKFFEKMQYKINVEDEHYHTLLRRLRMLSDATLKDRLRAERLVKQRAKSQSQSQSQSQSSSQSQLQVMNMTKLKTKMKAAIAPFSRLVLNQKLKTGLSKIRPSRRVEKPTS
jgi:hypothetical protein